MAWEREANHLSGKRSRAFPLQRSKQDMGARGLSAEYQFGWSRDPSFLSQCRDDCHSAYPGLRERVGNYLQFVKYGDRWVLSQIVTDGLENDVPPGRLAQEHMAHKRPANHHIQIAFDQKR